MTYNIVQSISSMLINCELMTMNIYYLFIKWAEYKFKLFN